MDSWTEELENKLIELLALIITRPPDGVLLAAAPLAARRLASLLDL